MLKHNELPLPIRRLHTRSDYLRNKEPTPSFEEIVKDVCRILNIKEAIIQGKSRKREIVTTRMILSYVANVLTNESLNEIGEYMNRHHSTVINHLETVEGLFKVGVAEDDFFETWYTYACSSELWNHYYKLQIEYLQKQKEKKSLLTHK